MRSELQVLASDEYEGRGVGTEGLNLASEFVRQRFAEAGLNMTAHEGDPFQEFSITGSPTLADPNTLSLVHGDDPPIALQFDSQFMPCSFGQPGSFSAPIVFCGYGIEADDLQYNDFIGVDVADKVVVMVRRTPFQSDPHGAFGLDHGSARHATLTTKLSNAFRRGAAAVLFVNDPYAARAEKEGYESGIVEASERTITASRQLVSAWINQGGDGAVDTAALEQELRAAVNHLEGLEQLLTNHNPDPLMEFGYSGTRSGRSIPVMHITVEACNQLLTQAMGMTLAEWEAAIDADGMPRSAVLEGWKVEGVCTFETPEVPVANVIGMLEGSGPTANETIVIGAHYDHVGLGGEGSLSPGVFEVHNGADDNGSGTVALTELARRLAERETPLPRRLMFIAFSGEERGLLGSAEYVNNPIVPLSDTVAMLNMDMVGRIEDSKLTIYGVGTSPVWDPLLEEYGTDFLMVKEPEGMGPSDHASFYPHQIPVLHFFSGLHNDYHRPGDDWEKINFEGIADVVDFVEALTIELAEAPERPAFTEVQGNAQLTRTGNRPYFGSIPDFGTSAEGYAITGSAPGSPADRAGLVAGDVIVQLGEHQIGSLDDFDLALRKFMAGEEVAVTVLRGEERVELKVTLGAPRE